MKDSDWRATHNVDTISGGLIKYPSTNECCLRPLIFSDGCLFISPEEPHSTNSNPSKRGQLCEKKDGLTLTTSCFWLANPDNHLIDNAAAGGCGRGFTYETITDLTPSTQWSGLGKFTHSYWNLDEMSPIKFGDFVGNRAHSMRSGYWATGCPENVPKIKAFTVFKTTDGFSWKKPNWGGPQGWVGGVSRGFTCDILYPLKTGAEKYPSLGQGASFIQVIDFNSGDNLRSGWWDGTRNHGIEFVRPLLVGRSNNKDITRTSQLQSTSTSPTMENRIGIILTWLTRVQDPICAGYKTTAHDIVSDACIGATADFGEGLCSGWAYVMGVFPESAVVGMKNLDGSNPVYMRGEEFKNQNRRASHCGWASQDVAFSLAAFEDVDGSLTGLGKNSWVLADSRPEVSVRSKVYSNSPDASAVAAKSARAPSDRCSFHRDMAAFVCKGDSDHVLRTFEIATMDVQANNGVGDAMRLQLSSEEGGTDVVSEWTWEASRNGFGGVTVMDAPLAMYPAFVGKRGGSAGLPTYTVTPIAPEVGIQFVVGVHSRSLPISSPYRFTLRPTSPKNEMSTMSEHQHGAPSLDEGAKFRLEFTQMELIRLERSPSAWGWDHQGPTRDMPAGERPLWSENIPVSPEVKSIDTSKCKSNEVLGENWATFHCGNKHLTIEVTGTRQVSVDSMPCNGHGAMHQYTRLNAGVNACPEGTAIQSALECFKAISSLGGKGQSPRNLPTSSYWPYHHDWPRGCSISKDDRLHFNPTGGPGKGHGGLEPVCRAKIQVGSCKCFKGWKGPFCGDFDATVCAKGQYFAELLEVGINGVGLQNDFRGAKPAETHCTDEIAPLKKGYEFLRNHVRWSQRHTWIGETDKTYHIDSVGGYNFVVNGVSIVQNWRFRSELDRRNYEAGRAHVIEGRPDDEVQSVTTHIPKLGTGATFSLEYYPRASSRVSNVNTAARQYLSFNLASTDGERGDVAGVAIESKITKSRSFVRKEPRGGATPNACVVACEKSYGFSAVSTKGDCLCFSGNDLFKAKPDAHLNNPVSCPGDYRVKECPAKDATELLVFVSTRIDYFRQGANTNCPQGAAITTPTECQKALKLLGLGESIAYTGHLSDHNVPAGCAANSDPGQHHFNTDLKSTKTRGDLSPICLKPRVAQTRADKLAKIDYYKSGANTNCPQGAAITTPTECLQALKLLGLGEKIAYNGDLSGFNVPAGCSANSDPDQHHFNTDLKSTKTRGDLSPICLKPKALRTGDQRA